MANLRSFLLLLVLLLIQASAMPIGLLANHPFHVALAETRWNLESGNLEVSIRVHPIDLETALQKLAKTKVDLDDEKESDRWIVKYLNERFVMHYELTEEAAKELPSKWDKELLASELNWVGKEVDEKWAWLHFELKPKSLDRPLWLTNRLLMEVLSDQSNTVLVRVEKKQQSLLFRANASTLAFPRPTEVAQPNTNQPNTNQSKKPSN